MDNEETSPAAADPIVSLLPVVPEVENGPVERGVLDYELRKLELEFEAKREKTLDARHARQDSFGFWKFLAVIAVVALVILAVAFRDDPEQLKNTLLELVKDVVLVGGGWAGKSVKDRQQKAGSELPVKSSDK